MPEIIKAEIKEFVEAAHSDLPKMQMLLAANPVLLSLPNGSETALGAACQMRRPDIIKYLLTQGTELNISAACVFGQTERVAKFLAHDPSLLSNGDKQAHSKRPLYFAENQPEALQFLMIKGAK